MHTQHRVRDFLAGVLFMALLVGAATPAGAAAAGKMIEIFGGITIYVDGVEMKPTDVNGNPVETFIYNGTTYVPLRAVSQSLGKVVNWDGSTRSVYIGEMPGTKQYLTSVLQPYQSIRYEAVPTTTLAGKKYANAISLGYGYLSGWALYNLNGQYKTLSFDMGHYDGSDMRKGTLNIYLDGQLSFSVDMEPEELPKHFTVPLYNALQMKLEMSNDCYDLGNVEIY